MTLALFISPDLFTGVNGLLDEIPRIGVSLVTPRILMGMLGVVEVLFPLKASLERCNNSALMAADFGFLIRVKCFSGNG